MALSSCNYKVLSPARKSQIHNRQTLLPYGPERQSHLTATDDISAMKSYSSHTTCFFHKSLSPLAPQHTWFRITERFAKTKEFNMRDCNSTRFFIKLWKNSENLLFASLCITVGRNSYATLLISNS